MSKRWNWNVVKHFQREFYQSIVTIDDLEDKKIFKFKIDEDEIYEVKGWVVKKNRKNYLVKDTYDGIPTEEIVPLKIKQSQEYAYRNDIYDVPTKVVSFKIPAIKSMTVKEWFDSFMCVSHTNPRAFEMYKGVILSSLLQRCNFRIATEPGFGKNSVMGVLYPLLKFDITAYTPKSAPKLMSCLEKQMLVIDEVPDLSKEQMELLEPVIRKAGDGSTDIENGALKVKGYTKDNYDISKLSIGFTYNEVSDYRNSDKRKDKSDKYFDYMFKPATCERFLPLKFDGRMNVEQFDLLDASDKEVYLMNQQFYKDWVAMTKWLLEGGFFEQLKKKNYDLDYEGYDFGKSLRLKNHFRLICNFFKVISDSQEEYRRYCNDLYSAYLDYKNMMDGL